MKTISIPIGDRAELLARCLDSIRANAGWKDWTIVASCEPPLSPPINALLNELPNLSVSWNPHKLGCWHNTFHAASVAMALTPSVNLYLEDDVVLAPDALAMVDAYATHSLTHPPSLLALRRWHAAQEYDQPATLSPASHGLLGQGIAWTAGLWPTAIRPGWFHYNSELPGQMWDWALSDFLDRYSIPQWRPLVNRSRHIGPGGDINHNGPFYEGLPIDRFEFYP